MERVGYMSMYREQNDRNPLNFDEVFFIGEKQKFRVGFTLIQYMSKQSSIFATYVLRTMDANRVCILTEQELSLCTICCSQHKHCKFAQSLLPFSWI